jgi:hypothetical protein
LAKATQNPNSPMDKAEIIIYQPDDQSTKLKVRIEDETVWLTQAQMVELFKSTKQNISLHINNIFREGELLPGSTVKEYLTIQTEGKRQVKRMVSVYNFDVIISVGYRVKSQRGTQFRIWANQVLKDYLLRGYAINQRFGIIENKLLEHEKKFELLIKTNIPPREGIFYEGQIFDAYHFIVKLIKSANKSIVLIDNYVDEGVLYLLSKRKPGVDATIFTATVSKQLKLDIERFNAQYAPVTIEIFNKSHDRFIIIDLDEVYHIGASLKDLGKKWFAFSRFNLNALTLINKLKPQKR